MAGEEKPHRSGHATACQPCRQRKSKCTLNNDTDPCLSCQTHGTVCTFRNAEARVRQPSTSITNKDSPSWKRRRALSHRNDLQQSENVMSNLGGNVWEQTASQDNVVHSSFHQFRRDTDPISSYTQGIIEGDGDVAHVVGPMTAFDNDILENYLSSISESFTSNRRLARAIAGDVEPVSAPIIFDTIRKRPLRASERQTLAAGKCEIIEMLVGSSIHQLIDLYFEFVNKNLPLFDKDNFLKLYREHRSCISPALLCNLYASALISWKQSKELITQRCPDIHFVWFKAGEALYSEMFLAPGMSTIIAVLLNVNGRPSTSMLGNGGLTGFAVSLANSLGLNRDPGAWQIPTTEKHLRIRIWWMVVLFDKWFSLGYGTPSRIQWSQFDVPYPTLEVLNISSESSPEEWAAGTIYIALLTLTGILNQYLEFVYSLEPNPTGVLPRTAEHLELDLNRWEDSLTGEVREVVIHKTNLHLPGASNFRLAYLGTRLFLRKIQLDLCLKLHSPSTKISSDASSRRSMQCQRAAEDIVHFVKHLRKDDLTGFWSPISAFALTSATTFLLRNTLRLPDSERHAPLKMAVEMINVLQKYHVDHAWDLPESCLKRWAGVVEQMSSLDEPNFDFPDVFQEDFGANQWVIEELFPDTWGMPMG